MMRTTTRGKKALASVVALGAIATFGALTTYSAWTSTTDATGSTFSAGTVSLTDDDAGTALFTLTGLLPGVATTRCINVSNSGTTPLTNVSLSASSSGLLSSVLNLKIDRGTGAAGGSARSCTGFSVGSTGIVDSLLNAAPSSSSPVDDATGWAAGATKSYRVTVTLALNADVSFQGKLASLDLTWTGSS